MIDPGLVLASASLVPHRNPLSGEDVLGLADAAAAAGFSGVVLWTAHVEWARRAGVDAAQLAGHHRSLGLEIPAVEVVLDWSDDTVLDTACEVGARDVVTVTLSDDLSFAELVPTLSGLADRAAGRGLRVSIEFLPWSSIPDLATVARLIDAVGRDNVGALIDVRHWTTQPGGHAAGLEALTSLSPEQVHQVQLCDVPRGVQADYRRLGRTSRLVPGHGVAPIADILSAIKGLGARPVIAVEVFNHALAATGARNMAREVYQPSASVARRLLGGDRVLRCSAPA